jgi:hypothetical protein
LGVDLDHISFGKKKQRKLFFRPGVLSRVWCLGPCDDLRGCGPDLATQRSLRRTGAEIRPEEFDDTQTRLDSDSDDEDDAEASMGFCSLLMKAELREAGKNLLIPRGQEQQLSGRILETKSCVF